MILRKISIQDLEKDLLLQIVVFHYSWGKVEGRAVGSKYHPSPIPKGGL